MGKERTDVIISELCLCVYFYIITSVKITVKEALVLYKSRDEFEKLFRGDKTYHGNKSIQVQSDESIHAKIFLEFVCWFFRNEIYDSLSGNKRTGKDRNDTTT